MIPQNTPTGDVTMPPIASLRIAVSCLYSPSGASTAASYTRSWMLTASALHASSALLTGNARQTLPSCATLQPGYALKTGDASQTSDTLLTAAASWTCQSLRSGEALCAGQALRAQEEERRQRQERSQSRHGEVPEGRNLGAALTLQADLLELAVGDRLDGARLDPEAVQPHDREEGEHEVPKIDLGLSFHGRGG